MARWFEGVIEVKLGWRAIASAYAWRAGFATVVVIGALSALLIYRARPQSSFDTALLRDPSMRTIGDLVSSGNLTAAVAHLDNAYRFDRRRGLDALQAFSILVLERGLHERDIFERYFAASALARAGSREGVPMLERAFASDPDLSIKMAAVDGIGDIGGATAVDSLQRLYRSSSDFDRRLVINSLADAQDPRAIEVLSDAVGRPDGTLRVAALQAMGKIGNRDAGPLLRRVMESPGPPIERAMAAVSLLKLGESADLVLVQQLLKNPSNGQGRPLAALALGYAHDTTVIPLLKNELSDDDLDVRIAAATALTHYHEWRGVDYLKKALVDEDDSVTREHTAQVLDQVAFDGGYEVLIAAIGSFDLNLQMSGVRALGLSGGAREVGVLNQMLPHVTDPLLRAQIAWSLGRIRNSNGIVTLISMVQENDPAVRYTAADALNRTAQHLLTEVKG